METIMDILDQFERRAIEAIKTDKQIKADCYESIGQYKLIMKIRKAIAMSFRKDWPRSKYILLWDSWHTGGLEQKIGKDAGILKQAYTIERIKREAKRNKYQVREIRNDQSVRLVLRV